MSVVATCHLRGCGAGVDGFHERIANTAATAIAIATRTIVVKT